MELWPFSSSSRRSISLDLSRLATTLNRLERFYQTGSTSGIRACRETLRADDENPPPPVVTPTQQAPHIVSTIKLPFLKKDTNGQIKVLPPKTAKEILAKEKERKARTTLLMAIPEDHLAKFHKMTDAKEMWDDIKSRFGVSTEDANQKFLRVFKTDVKGSTGSSSSTQNVAFVSFESTSSTNDVNHEDLEQIDEFDLKEMDLKWQVAMISMRLKKFYKKIGRKLQSKGNQDIRRRDAGNTRYKAKDNRRRLGKQEEPKALVTIDEYGVDWTGHAEDEQENFALMAYSHSGSDTKMSVKEKLGLGFSEQVKENELYDEALMSVFDSHSSDIEDAHVYDKFAKVKGMHGSSSNDRKLHAS
ncbi:hypothetical protein Tco_1120594 [Tanacetum coccineum]